MIKIEKPKSQIRFKDLKFGNTSYTTGSTSSTDVQCDIDENNFVDVDCDGIAGKIHYSERNMYFFEINGYCTPFKFTPLPTSDFSGAFGIMID